MNILFLTTHLNTGGISIYLKSLAKEFTKKGHRVWVASSGGDMVGQLTAMGIEHLPLNIRTKSELNLRIYWALGRLGRLIKEEKMDVIHAQTRITQVMGTLLSKMSGRVYLSTCHGFFKKRLVRRIFPGWGRAVIAISEPVVQHLADDFGIEKGKIAFIHHGLDIHDFPVIDENIRQQRRREFPLPATPVIGIIARLSEVKGHHVLIEAMRTVVQKFPQGLLLIVGQGKRENFLKELAAQRKLQDNVRFLPTVNKTSTVLGLMDIFVMPSLQEGLGLSVMEAQASGLPVVASRVGGLQSLIRHGETGLLVEPNDAQGLSQAIIQLLSDRAKAQWLGQAARKFIEQECSVTEMAEETLRLYEHLLKEAR